MGILSLKKLFFRDWKIMFKNPILLVPDIFYLIVFGIITFLIGWFSGIFPFLTNNINLINNADFNDVFVEFLAENWFKALISLSIFFISSFFIGASASAVKFWMVEDVLTKGKTSFIRAYIQGKKFILKVVGVKIIVYLISLILILLLFLVSSLFYIFNRSISNTSLGILFVFGLLLYFFVNRVVSVYLYSIIYFDKKGVLSSLRIFYKFLKKKRLFVLSVSLVVFLMLIIFNSLSSYFNLSLTLLNLIFLWVFLHLIFNLILTVWSNVFVFDSYRINR